jgi:C_GCAxxG_C_C family probable redox protein
MMRIHDIIHRAYSLGFDYEKKYRGCSQCTIAAIQDALNVRNDNLFKVASGLVGGGGLSCDGVCGGYSGAVMMMSAFFGRREKFDGDREEKYCAFHMAKALQEKYVQEDGSLLCKDIHLKLFGRTFDLWDEKEKVEFEKAGAHSEKCPSVVANASNWATKLILEELSKRELTLKDFEDMGMFSL